VYLEIGRKATHLREPGISDRAIARALGVSDKTVAKSLRALGALGRSVGAHEGEPTQR
jgi:biotin operon repressor